MITEATSEKLRGGFYTPEPIAAFLLRWGINGSNNSDVLEPSCGDGVFFEALAKDATLKNASMTSFELNDDEADKAKARVRKLNLGSTKVHKDDFLN